MPMAHTLPSLAYENRGTKQAAAALFKLGRWLWGFMEGPWARQQAPQRAPPLNLNLFCSWVGARSAAFIFFQKLASRQNGEGEGPGPKQSW